MENGATVIPMEEPKKEEPVENRGETIVTLDEPKAQEQPKVQVQPKAEEKTKVQQQPQQPKSAETKPREDDIYFDDTPTSNKQDKNKENKIDLEDEYYDLDGF